MVRKFRHFAIRQAALTRQKKRRGSLSQRQRELSTPTPQSSQAEGADTIEETKPAAQGETSPLPEPAGEDALEAAPTTPWRYTYVLADIKRIGVLASAILGLLVVMSFFLG
ncbi:MAG: hypothetical protein V3U79_03545 [Dehalococcoidia bacterium]